MDAEITAKKRANNWTWLIYDIALLVTVVIPSGCYDNRAGGFVFSVMSYNTGNFNAPIPTTEQVANVFRKHGLPDVLFLQDTPWLLEIKDLAALLGLPYFVTGKTLSPRNTLGILSRYPLHNLDVIQFREGIPRPAAMCAETRLAAKDVLLCSVHLQSPSGKVRRGRYTNEVNLAELYGVLRDELFRDTQRSRDAERFLDWLDSKHADIVIIGGDFNSFPLSKAVRTMTARFNDAFWPSWSYFQGTYTGLDFPLKPRLDYIFYSKGVVSVGTKVIKEAVGDHFPVQATFNLPVDSVVP